MPKSFFRKLQIPFSAESFPCILPATTRLWRLVEPMPPSRPQPAEQRRPTTCKWQTHKVEGRLRASAGSNRNMHPLLSCLTYYSFQLNSTRLNRVLGAFKRDHLTTFKSDEPPLLCQLSATQPQMAIGRELSCMPWILLSPIALGSGRRRVMFERPRWPKAVELTDYHQCRQQPNSEVLRRV